MVSVSVIIIVVLVVGVATPCLVFLLGWLLMLFSLKANKAMPIRVKRIITKTIRIILCKDVKPFGLNKVSGRIFLGAMPRTQEDLNSLEREGIKYIVTLNENWEFATRSQVLNEQAMKDHCFDWLLLPTPDYNPPALKDVTAAIEWSIRQAGNDCAEDLPGQHQRRGIFIHCNAGKGRSAVVVICLLIRLLGMASGDAYSLVREKRKISAMGPCKGRCLRTAQWKTIVAYERLHKGQTGSSASAKSAKTAWTEDDEKNQGAKTNPRNV